MDARQVVTSLDPALIPLAPLIGAVAAYALGRKNRVFSGDSHPSGGRFIFADSKGSRRSWANRCERDGLVAMVRNGRLPI